MKKPGYLFSVLVFVFATHIFTAITGVSNMVWDECYYVPAAHDLLRGLSSNIEHPFLAKALMAIPIGLLGDSWFSWRIVSIISAVVATYFVYQIARRFLSEKASLYAAALLSASTLFLLVGSAGLLDMPSIAFTLAAMYYGLNNKYAISGVLFGLSVLCKEQALLIAAPFLIYQLLKLDQRKAKRLFNVAITAGLIMLIVISGLWAYELAYRPTVEGTPVTNPFQHLLIIEAYQIRLNTIVRATSEYRWYPPIAWITPFGANAMNTLNWYYAIYNGHMLVAWQAQPNPNIEYYMLPLLFALPYFMFKRKENLAWLLWLSLASTFLPWFIAGLFVKTESNFYLTYSTPFLAIGATYLFTKIKNTNLKYFVAVLNLSLAYGFFVYYFPYILIPR